MTLTVKIISKDQEFDVKDLEKEIIYPRNDLFGFESWRLKLWGHDIIKTLGCDLIHSLCETDVYVYNAEVNKLKMELIKILENIELVEEQTNIDGQSIEFRVKNALAAIEVAEKNIEKVGVVIW